MNTLLNLLKDYQVGKWCKIAAWIIAAIGVVEIVLGIYTNLAIYNVNARYLPPNFLWQEIRVDIAIIPTLLFYFSLLYAAGAIVDRFIATTEEDDTEELIEDEEVIPGQMR